MANHTILIIDYEPRNVEAASHPLEKAGYQVATAADGVAGMKAFESLNPSLVLIEAMLPKKHGFEVCQEIKKTTHGKRTPVVITTAVYRGRKYRTQALHIYGADEYLEKPFTGDQLLEVCFRFLGEPPGVVPEADESQRQIAVNERAVEPPMASAPTATPAPPTQAPGAFSKIVGDLTEEEITARLDAILPGELTDLADEGVIAADPAPVVPEPTDEMPAGLTVVDDLPPEIGDTFIAVEQPATESPVGPPPMIESEPEPAQHHEESVAAAEVVPEQPPEQPQEEPAEEPPEETSEAAVEKKAAEEKTDEVADEADDASNDVELDAGRGRKRQRKKKKRGARAKSSKSAAVDQAADADPASTPAPEATTDAPELEAAAEQQTEAAPVSEEAAEPQAEETATEETLDQPRNEMDELADVVSAAIDQMQVFDEPEAEEPTVDETAAEEAASVELAVEEPVAEEPAAEVAAEQEAVPETDTLEEVPRKVLAEPTPGRKAGLWIGVAAAVFVGLAVTMFFVFRDGAEGTNTAGAMPEVTPAPAKVRTTTPSSPARNESSANAAVVMGPGAGSSVPEPATTVTAAAATAKPELPVVEPTPPPETETTAAEVENAPEEPTPASDDEATKIEEIETLAPAVIAPMVEDPTAGSVPATVTDSESVDLDPEPPVETTTQVEESLPEPAAAFHDDAQAEPEPALENEPIVDEPTPVAPPPAPKAATGDLVPLHQVDQQPTPLDQPRPLYPVSARRLRQEGTVVLNLLVDENGDVTEVEMIRGVSEELDGAAIRAVKGWSYRPARKDGASVKVWKPEKVAFKL